MIILIITIETIIITVAIVLILKGNIKNTAKFIYRTISNIKSIRNVIKIVITNVSRCI